MFIFNFVVGQNECGKKNLTILKGNQKTYIE